MRVAIVTGPYIPVPPPQYGGTELVVSYLIQGLIEAGHEPVLLGPGDSTADCQIVPIVDKALFFPKHKKDLAAHQLKVKRAEKTTNRKLNSLLPSVDIIHSHGFDIRRFQHFPHAITLHNRITFDDLAYYQRRKQMNFVSISKNQQASCPELNYVGAVYNGEDPDVFPLNTEPEDYVCFLGRFDRDKNPHLAIQLAISYGIKIKLAGKIDLWGQDYFKQEIEQYLDHPLVEYLGELGFDEKVDLLCKARCNLHPTNFREPFGLTVLEAAYCGTPTLAIARGSMPELIEEGRTGLLVEDFIEGRHHIEKCFAMDRSYIASRARQLFNYRTMTENYVQVYEDVIRTTPSPYKRKNLISSLMQSVHAGLKRL